MKPATAPTEAPAIPAPRSWRARWNRLDQRATPYAFISPYFILFAVIGVFPLVYTAWISLRQWHLIGGDGGYVGFQNYVDVLHQEDFWIALRNTVSIFLLAAVPQVIMATIIASALSANLRAKTFWRMGVLVPYVLAPVAVALIFSDLFGDSFGLINQGLTSLGMAPVRWHTNALASHFAISVIVNFRFTGYNSLILLAAMLAVPQDYLEAAVLDGAGKVRSFFSVVLPLIRPTMIFIVLTATIQGLQIFDEPQLYGAEPGGDDQQWLTLTMYLYQLGWRQSNLGRASAVAWLLFIFIVVIAAVNFTLMRRLRGETQAGRGR
jgi:cellobiose transport system permease protein